jgi:hypothetical protein
MARTWCASDLAPFGEEDERGRVLAGAVPTLAWRLKRAGAAISPLTDAAVRAIIKRGETNGVDWRRRVASP